jgi:hypothetical protein
MNLFSKTASLVLLARLKPEMYDALIPYSPKISEGTRNVMASMVAKAIAKEITDSAIENKLELAGKNLFRAGAESMDYEDDNWCLTPAPPRRIPHPFGPSPEPWLMEEIMFGNPVPWSLTEETMLNPQPMPPHEQTYYGALLTLLSDAVSVKDISENLRNIGDSLMKQDADANEKNVKASSYSTFEKNEK